MKNIVYFLPAQPLFKAFVYMQNDTWMVTLGLRSRQRYKTNFHLGFQA